MRIGGGEDIGEARGGGIGGGREGEEDGEGDDGEHEGVGKGHGFSGFEEREEGFQIGRRQSTADGNVLSHGGKM